MARNGETTYLTITILDMAGEPHFLTHTYKAKAGKKTFPFLPVETLFLTKISWPGQVGHRHGISVKLYTILRCEHFFYTQKCTQGKIFVDSPL